MPSPRTSLLLLVLLLVLLLTGGARAQSYRVSSDAYGAYYNDYTITSTLFGLDANGDPKSVNGATYYGSDSKYTYGSDANALPPAASYSGTWAGDASRGMTTVTAQGYAQTNWGSNHASASVSGFTAINQDYDGTFTAAGGISAPMHFTSNTQALSSAHSSWEELYQIGGGTGTGQFTGAVHIDGTLSGAGATASARMYWSLQTFSGSLVAAVSASYDGAADSWSKSVFADGSWTTTSGSGALAISEDVSGSYSFTYNSPLYLASELSTWVSGNTDADFANTVSFTGMSLPADSLVYIFSGSKPQSYGLKFAGSGAGTICDTLACTTGNVGNVPEPASYALLLSGIGVVAWVLRRSRQISS